MGKRFRKCKKYEDSYKKKDDNLHKLTCRKNKNAISVEKAKKQLTQRKRVKRVVTSVPEDFGSNSASYEEQHCINSTCQLV